ncbi:PREDICTED: 3-hydroxyisobutyryl-CoA hydrolase, mitochondrial-like isoform X2 [Polistes dominula]|uniref:3-hydroxyisobutyryl-CoA hydrolase, mitochondrial n=1 Tax=Polistes dominula TaxID=743375 RepID=A0ABM1JDT9_POLDO|nr:PREDICTED: 3-hydroxyisobutyryl-CoA hydrolase, mitochondrial-like isoform X2 [Polistes dominula]
MLKSTTRKFNHTNYGIFTTCYRIRQLLVRDNSALNKNAGKNRMMNTSTYNDEVLFKEIKDKGIITLNRPKVLNALNLSMVQKIYPVLKEWESTRKFVIIEGTGNKAFCAGGDVKAIINSLNEPSGSLLGENFFRDEYTLNHLIGTYKKPYIAIIHGITMGGGVGLSVHGKYRIATENTLFAMPETAIGLFPDVGGSYFLSRLKGKLGLYLGLTGHRLQGIDVLHAGIATHFIPSERLQDLKDDLLKLDTDHIEQVLNKYQPKDLMNEFSLSPYMHKIEKCFSSSSVEEIIERLNKDNSEWANQIVQILLKMSPTSLKVTKKCIEEGSKLTLRECLKMEYRLSCACLHKNSDFYEGVTTLLIKKDKNPTWNPKSLYEITDEYISQRFQNLPDDKELQI